MNCEELKALVFGYFEGVLSEEQRAAFDTHHQGCESCAEFVATAKSLNCQEFTEFLADYFDGDLSAGQKAVFGRHMDLCPPCREYLKSYEQTVHIGKQVCCEGQALPPDVPEKLVRAILEARKREG